MVPGVGLAFRASSARVGAAVTFGAEPDTDPDVPALRALARGDMDGLRILADRHGPGLLSFLTGLTGDRQLAEEVLQDTWVALWRGAAGFVGGSTVRTWIYGIGRRRARDALRRRRPDLPDDGTVTLSAVDPAAGPERLAMVRADVDAVAAAMSGLRPLHREVLLLACVHEMTTPEIAAVLDVPVGTVKSRLSNARATLVTALSHAQATGGGTDEH